MQIGFHDNVNFLLVFEFVLLFTLKKTFKQLNQRFVAWRTWLKRLFIILAYLKSKKIQKPKYCLNFGVNSRTVESSFSLAYKADEKSGVYKQMMQSFVFRCFFTCKLVERGWTDTRQQVLNVSANRDSRHRFWKSSDFKKYGLTVQ